MELLSANEFVSVICACLTVLPESKYC